MAGLLDLVEEDLAVGVLHSTPLPTVVEALLVPTGPGRGSPHLSNQGSMGASV